MDLFDLRARMMVAQGQAPSSFRELIQYKTGSESGAMVYVRRGPDWKVRLDEGPFHTQHGATQNVVWHQDENGFVVVAPGRAAFVPDIGAPAPPLAGSVSRVSKPVDAWLISNVDKSGIGTKMYVDPVTFLPVRIERITPNGSIVTTHDDFRKEGSWTISHHWVTQNAVTNTVTESRVALFDSAPVDAKDVAWPGITRELVEFPAGEKNVSLPARFEGPRIYVRVMVGARGLDFILDTGSSGIMIDSDVARELGLTQYDVRSTVQAGRTTTARALVPEMHVGPLVMRNVAVHVLPQGYNERADTKVVGLLGFDFLATLGVTIDYEHKTVTVCRASDYVAPSGENVFALDARLTTQQPQVNVSIDGTQSDSFVVDTGSPGTVLIVDHFIREHPDALKAAKRMSRSEGQGVGGRFEQQDYRVNEIRLGPIAFKNFMVEQVLPRSSYDFSTDGVVGAELLSYFTVGLDYSDGKIYLQRNGKK